MLWTRSNRDQDGTSTTSGVDSRTTRNDCGFHRPEMCQFCSCGGLCCGPDRRTKSLLDTSRAGNFGVVAPVETGRSKRLTGLLGTPNYWLIFALGSRCFSCWLHRSYNRLEYAYGITKKMMRHFGFFAWIFTGLFFGGWAAWQAHDNEHPYIYDGPNSIISPNPAHQEASVTVRWVLKEPPKKLCPGAIQRMFLTPDGVVITTLDTTPLSSTVKSGDRQIPRTFELPPELPSKVLYQVRICWECNTYQRLIKPLCTFTPRIPLEVLDARR